MGRWLQNHLVPATYRVLGDSWTSFLDPISLKVVKGFICLTSTFEDRKGNLESRIRPILTPGATVTVSRSLNFYVITEYV